MNYGAEPADQVVRYSLEGMEYSLKITGNVAKHVAIFIAAALKDQKRESRHLVSVSCAASAPLTYSVR